MLTARDAISVLVDREVLKLVAVVFVGWWMIWTGTTATSWIEFSGALRGFDDALGLLSVLAGTVLSFGGTLALLVKLVADAVVIANAN